MAGQLQTENWAMVNFMLKAKLKLVSKVIQNPRNVREISHYLKNDFNTFRGAYQYDHPIIFIAGLPKSGTTWLRTIMALLPGYNIRLIYDPTGSINRRDISDDIFNALPKNRYSIIKVHTQYSDENFKIITQHIQRFIVMYRDLRDMCVSRYIHIKNDKMHSLFRDYNQWPEDKGILHSIEFVHKEFVPWVENWRQASERHPEKILMVQYEQLNSGLKETLEKIFQFYGIDVDDVIVDKMFQTQLRGEADIQKNLDAIDHRMGRLKSTARKGIIGDWKNYFNAEHKVRFKELIGENLIRWGYEKDLNW